MTPEAFIFAIFIALLVFGLVYRWLYLKYRNVDKSYEVARDTKSEALNVEVMSQFTKTRKGLKDSTISGDNVDDYKSRVTRIEH